MLYELSYLAVGNLLRARARLAMTSGGVLVGTTAVILLIAFTIGLQKAAEAGIGNNAALTEIQVYPNWSRDSSAGDIPQLDVDAVRALWQIPGVQAVIPVVNMAGGGEIAAGDYLGYVQIMGIDPALLPYLNLTAQQNTSPTGQLVLDSGMAIVGARAGDYFYDPESESESFEPVAVDLFASAPLTLNVYQWSGEQPATQEVDVNISAVLAEGTSFDYAMLLPLEDVIELNEWTNQTPFDPDTFVFDQIIVRTTSRETTNEVSTAIRELGFEAGGLGDFLNQLNSFFVTMRLLLGGVGGVALLVAAFGVANTMTMAILERTKEIGLMKAIGATDRDVLTVFLIEAGLVGLTGGLAGVGLSYFLQNLINEAVRNIPADGGGGGIMFLPFDPAQIGGNLVVIPSELAIGAVLLATAVGIGAGLYPALRAARMLPVVALKAE